MAEQPNAQDHTSTYHTIRHTYNSFPFSFVCQWPHALPRYLLPTAFMYTYMLRLHWNLYAQRFHVTHVT